MGLNENDWRIFFEGLCVRYEYSIQESPLFALWGLCDRVVVDWSKEEAYIAADKLWFLFSEIKERKRRRNPFAFCGWCQRFRLQFFFSLREEETLSMYLLQVYLHFPSQLSGWWMNRDVRRTALSLSLASSPLLRYAWLRSLLFGLSRFLGGRFWVRLLFFAQYTFCVTGHVELQRQGQIAHKQQSAGWRQMTRPARAALDNGKKFKTLSIAPWKSQLTQYLLILES